MHLQRWIGNFFLGGGYMSYSTDCKNNRFEKKLIAFMRVFPEVIVLTTKPRIDAYVLFT